MPKPTLTVIEGGNEPIDEEERVRQQLKNIEESIERLVQAFEYQERQRARRNTFTERSWRQRKKWRP